MMDTDDFFTVAEVCKRTGFTRQHVYTLIRDGSLDGDRMEGRKEVHVTGVSLRDFMVRRITKMSGELDFLMANLPATGLRERMADMRAALQTEQV